MANNITLKKNISTLSLTMTGVTAIVGSGWLLSTQRLSNVAGPAAMIAWVVGMLIAMSVALCFIEVGGSIRSAGGIGYYSRVTHGKFSGFLTSWINWLSIATVPAIEAQAIVQYLSQSSPHFMGWYDNQHHIMSMPGILVAVVLMFLFMYINYWSVKLFIRFNNILTMLKLIVPIITVFCLLFAGLHTQNFGTNMQQFLPFGWKSIFVSVVSCGVIMSFNGFQVPMNFSEEVKNPRRQITIAVIGSILLTFVLYLALQAVFIGAIDPKSAAHGWNYVNLRSPYVNLLIAANLQVMVWAVYVSSGISPTASGAAFVASSSRMLYALSKEGFLPKPLSKLNARYHSPRNAVLACTLVGCVYLFLFRSWSSLVTVVSVLHIFSYLPAPIIVIANRIKKSQANIKTSEFKLPCVNIVAPVIFVLLSVLLFLAAWPLTAELAALILPGLVFFYYYELRHRSFKEQLKLFKGASWIIAQLIGISVFCYLGNNPHGGNILSMNAAIISLIVFSLIVFVYGAYFSYNKEDTVTEFQALIIGEDDEENVQCSNVN
jgi:amino acid transporter